uniref:PDEase domain-containing protein n=1 Tax=Spongospora subterranea TaxID=70186 RepID=A0A0H5R7C7_9EUKA|eukprot:CRZ09716.1 hypothetical protein [Spongospora subterranea]
MAALLHDGKPGILRTKSESAAGNIRDLHGRRNAICLGLSSYPKMLQPRRNAICEALETFSVQCLAEFRLGMLSMWMPEGSSEFRDAQFPNSFDRITFNAFAWSEDNMFKCLKWVLCESELLKCLKLQEPIVLSFLRQVRMGYAKYSNPYHTFRHAFDVTQFCYLLLSGGDCREVFTKHQCLALIIAAICHDLEHPGTDFAFQNCIESHLSTKYHGCQSPLESHHLSCCRLILDEPDSDVLANFSPEIRLEIIDMIGKCILATDMSIHSDIVKNWHEKVGDGVVNVKASPQELTIMILQMFIKIADISNVCRPWPVSVKWSQSLIDELMRVHDSVLGLGHIPNSFLTSVASEPEKVVYAFSVNIARPLLEIIVQILPRTRPLLSVLDSNANRWIQGS